MSEQDDARQESTVSAYEAEGITVFYDKSRCIHAAECVRGLPPVFDTDRRPWIQPEGADAEAVAEVVRRCPSGALQYDLAGGPDEQPDSPTRVDPQVDGPLVIRGDLRIALDEGLLTETRATMCRCGRSGNKPFCDKTCERSGWSSTWHPPAEPAGEA